MSEQGLRMMAKDQNGNARGLEINALGGMKTSLISPNIGNGVLDMATSGSRSLETNGALSLVMRLENPNNDEFVFCVEGLTEDGGSYVQVPVIDGNGVARYDSVNKEGLYFVNLSGLERVRIKRYSSSVTAKVHYNLSHTPCPNPLEAPVKYIRITPTDNAVSGKFKAIEPLSDITLHSDTRFLGEGISPSSGVGVIQTGDVRLTGQTLFGHFQRVRISSGAALLVLL